MKISIASDHGGFDLKEDLRAWLTGQGHEVVDFARLRLTCCRSGKVLFSKCDPIEDRTSQGEFIRIFQIVSYGDAFGDGTDSQTRPVFDFFVDEIACCITFDSGAQGKDNFFDFFLFYPL